MAKRLHAREGHVHKNFPTDACECLYSRKLQQVEREAVLMALDHLETRIINNPGYSQRELEYVRERWANEEVPARP